MSSAGLSDERDGQLILLQRRRFVYTPVNWSKTTLILSMSMLVLAPLFISDAYSIIEHTLSESGAQGVEGAWVFRTGVDLAASSVLVMTFSPRQTWTAAARWWLRIYAVALLMLTMFPEAPLDGSAHDETVAMLHTVFAVVGAVSFILGVVTVSGTRSRHDIQARVFDWFVIAAVALLPQIMVLVRVDGLLQRIMVAFGYVWLLAESSRIARPMHTPL
jgi:hypothetical membrane protein